MIPTENDVDVHRFVDLCKEEGIVIYLLSPVFAHGELHFALSRVGDPTNITMMVTHPPLHGQPPPSYHAQCSL